MAILFGFISATWLAAPGGGGDGMTDVAVRGLSKSFGSNQVLKALDLAVPSRQFVTLLGPSGCGKTTLLRLIAGLESASAGEIRFGERRVDRLPPGERNIAMVFQSYALYPTMDVARNIGYGLEVRAPPSRRREKWAPSPGAGDRASVAAAEQLSGASATRRAGPRHGAAAGHLPMDEPLSNSTPSCARRWRGAAAFHFDLGTTTIYVTHDHSKP